MLFHTTLFVATAALFANSALATPVAGGLEARAALIATSPYYACNCPNNCSHKSGSSCKYYAGPSDGSEVINGKCQYQGSQLNCVAT